LAFSGKLRLILDLRFLDFGLTGDSTLRERLAPFNPKSESKISLTSQSPVRLEHHVYLRAQSEPRPLRRVFREQGEVLSPVELHLALLEVLFLRQPFLAPWRSVQVLPFW